MISLVYTIICLITSTIIYPIITFTIVLHKTVIGFFSGNHQFFQNQLKIGCFHVLRNSRNGLFRGKLDILWGI